MIGMKRIIRFFGLSFVLLIVWPGTAAAGVPSPAPTGAANVDAPEIQIANLGDFRFENGEVVKDFKVSFVTHGRLNEKKDNIILAMHGSWGSHAILDFLIGPGRALDSSKYFIVATDRLGSPLFKPDITTGPTNSGLKMDFPYYSIRDEVNLEYKLLNEHFGFDQILAVIGTSLGGQKAYQFGVSYPNFAHGLIPMFSSPVANPRTKALARNLNAILETASGWHGGNYEANPSWAVNTMLWSLILWIYTPEWYATNLITDEAYRKWRELWKNILRKYPQDARDWYYTNLSWGDFDIGNTPGFNGHAKAALQSILAQVLIIGSKGDMMFRPEESIFAERAIPNATYLEIDTPWGHNTCCGWDPEGSQIMGKKIAQFLGNLEVMDNQ